MKLEIKCNDGVWRYVFCRAMNGGYDFKTDSAVITTERKANAYKSFGEEQARKDVEYFTQHSHGCPVRIAA